MVINHEWNTISYMGGAICMFNPFMPNVFSYTYQLDKSISNFRVIGRYFSFSFKF